MTASYFLLVLISSSLRVPDAMIPDGINGKYDITLDEIPRTFELDVLDKNEQLTKLHLWPRWEKQKLRFTIGDNDYNLEYGIECATHYYGEKCDVFCHPWHDTHFTCSDAGEKICDSGWMGENCTQQMNPCENSPCLNGGRCKAVNGVVFTCSCDDGFEGMLCDRRKRISTTTSTTPRQTSERTTTSSTTASTTMKSVSTATVPLVPMEKKEIISVIVKGTAEAAESDGTATKLVVGLLALLFICLLAIILILFYRKRTSSSAANLPTSVVMDSTCSKEKKDSKNSSSPERPESPRYSNPPWMKKGSSLELPSPPVIPAPTPSLKISSNPLDV